ncbi:MAG TPA: hypothetical protein VGZ00_06755 [Candidatus Baltobacteraceae bacterium]|jgi:hypothetical protein|nr:hypothetical protein [Candidatus Baltobacteraceae bacterium]
MGNWLRGLIVFMMVLLVGGRASAAPTIDGISCDRMEGSAFHIHQHLAIFDHGKLVRIPNDVGRPPFDGCFYWLHTHTDDGIIHVESPTFRTFTLGAFFDIWGQPLSDKQVGPIKISRGKVRTYVDSELYMGNLRAIELFQHTDIVIELGPPYTHPKLFTDWNGN